MKDRVKNNDLEKRIFAASAENFNQLALELFQFQHRNNDMYRQYCDLLKIDARGVDALYKIPFLPISFFKTHTVKTTAFEPESIFESSGTTGLTRSKHHVKDGSLYRKSFTECFRKFYGAPESKCILALLPSYMEKKNSSLVMMADELIRICDHPLSGFYANDLGRLHRTILHNEILKLPTLLIGVTHALLDFAEQFPMQLRNTIIVETGGMKGRREELTRQQVHRQLQQQLGLSLVHSEYGMTELLSQAWSKGDGIFHCPPWMKILLREADDPLHLVEVKEEDQDPFSGAINVIDLANIYSCAFIATEDTGRLYSNGSFEVLGRLDNSDIRGCSLMTI